ncbi:MAG: DUF4133 domain-containing protein [Alistipes sp.]|jgi:predicted membrane chloride channel (bestrophin family)|nr:DUF4133 domain-containing protein [Alistipes sp.]
MEFPINRGIGKPAEFQGLSAQYLFIFAGGLLGLFIVVVVMYMAGASHWTSIGFGVVSASILVYGTFRLNRKYGRHGLMKAQARRSHPRYVINRRNFPRLLTTAKERKQ